MNQPGTLDTSFLITGLDIDSEVYVIKVLPDNSILIGGKFDNVSGHTTDSIAKLNPDGSVDTAFISYLDDGQVFDIVVDDYGIIWVAGNFTSYSGISTNFLIKLNSDGTLNQTFSTLFNPDKGLYTLKIQPDGKVLCGGSFIEFSGNSVPFLVRLNNDGTEDTFFTSNMGSGFSDNVFDIEIDSNGDIFVGGDFITYNGNTTNYICKLDGDGNLLSSFGSGLNASSKKIVIQPDGKIIIGGNFSSFDGNSSQYLVRITNTGVIDVSFSIIPYPVYSLYLQNDGRIIVGCTSSSFLRLNPSGTQDGSWYSSNPNGDVFDIIETTDGKILIGGNFTYVDNVYQNYLARLFNDDSTYQYQYVYEAYSCLDNIQSTILYIGSDVELALNDVIYSQNLIQQSRFGCMVISSLLNIYDTADWRYISSYVDCTSCLSSTTFTATTTECISGEGDVFIVSNQFQVGDIFSIDSSLTIEGNEYNLSACLEITSLGLINPEVFDPLEYLNVFILSEVPYFPRESCDSCYSCNGIWYSYEDCTNSGDTGILVSTKILSEGQCFYLPSGTTSCKKIVSQQNVLVNQRPNFTYIGGQLYDSCEMCSADTSSTLCTFQLCGSLYGSVTGYTSVSNTLIDVVNMGKTNSFCFQITGIADVETIAEGSIFLFGDIITEFYSGDCTTCNTLIPATLVPCNGGNPIYTRLNEMTLIESVQSNNTIFLLGSQCYSFFSECSVSNTTSLTYPNSSFATCEICNQPLSAGTEYEVCVVCSPCGSCSGTVTSVSAPHPTWTNLDGKSVVILDAVTLGGPNGLNN